MSNVVTDDEFPVDSVLNADVDRARFRLLDGAPSLPLADAIKTATNETGSGTSWLSGFWKTVNGPGKLTAAEYFYYGLYKGNRSDDALCRFVGKSAQEKLHRACCDPTWFALARDKMLFLSTMRGAAIPVPEDIAIFDPKDVRSHAAAIYSKSALISFLDQPTVYPIFAKPIDGMYSIGVLSLTDGGNGRAHARGVGDVSTEDIADYMIAMSADGYVMQRTLRPAPQLHEWFGGALATVRFLVLVGDEGPVIESAVIKVPVAESIADNYWRRGNMLGALDIASGMIKRVVTGTGAGLCDVQNHPDTGTPIAGLPIPDWRAAKALCVRAAGGLPGLRTQSWDIALTNKGPVALEVNWGGDLNLHQLAHDKGVLTENYCTHLRRNGYKGKLPAFD